MTPHPLRESLHNEVHARPCERLTAPLLLSHVALVGPLAGAACEHMAELLCSKRHLLPPAPDANHLSVDLGGVHLRWEKHTEFHIYTFWKTLQGAAGTASFDGTAIAELPPEWLVGLHMLVLDEPGLKQPALVISPALRELVAAGLSDDGLAGANVVDGDAQVYTDLRLRADGFSRIVFATDGMNPRRLGRAAPAGAERAHLAHQQPAAHARRDRAAAKQPGPARPDETPPEGAVADAGRSRGFVGGRRHVLRHRAGGLPGEGRKGGGLGVAPDVIVAISIPLIAVAVWMGIRRLHRNAHAVADR